jgi:BolA family transcriptional regulator, general stress-responsive regulator
MRRIARVWWLLGRLTRLANQTCAILDRAARARQRGCVMTVADRIRGKLQALHPVRLAVIDDSHRHLGHAGARPEGETHFRVEIVAPGFAGKSRLERQRAVYALLAEELAGGVHALQIAALAPDEDRGG